VSSHSTEQVLQAGIEASAQACRFAFNEMQMQVKQDTGSSFRADEKLRFGFANPAKLAVSLAADGESCLVSVRSSNFGFGPMQGGHVKGVAETFLSNVRLHLDRTSQQAKSAPGGIADDIQKLGALKAQGLLTDEEFSAAKAKLLGR
jgi:hypothetical protein